MSSSNACLPGERPGDFCFGDAGASAVISVSSHSAACAFSKLAAKSTVPPVPPEMVPSGSSSTDILDAAEATLSNCFLDEGFLSTADFFFSLDTGGFTAAGFFSGAGSGAASAETAGGGPGGDAGGKLVAGESRTGLPGGAGAGPGGGPMFSSSFSFEPPVAGLEEEVGRPGGGVSFAFSDSLASDVLSASLGATLLLPAVAGGGVVFGFTFEAVSLSSSAAFAAFGPASAACLVEDFDEPLGTAGPDDAATFIFFVAAVEQRTGFSALAEPPVPLPVSDDALSAVVPEPPVPLPDCPDGCAAGGWAGGLAGGCTGGWAGGWAGG